MAANVIDSLVVTLGLNSKGFSEGIKGSSEQLAGFTRRLTGMFVAVRGIEDVVGYFKDLHHQLAEIGFTSRNLGVAGTELKKLGEVSELFGGQMQDAVDSVEGLQSAVFNLRYRGQLSDSLMMLQRFGVAYLTATGHAREFKDIAFDAAKAIERQAKVTGMTPGERYQMALSFGFTGGIASAVAQGGKGLEDALSKAKIDQRALTEKTIQGQTRLDQSLTRMRERIDAQSSVILAKLTPAITRLNAIMERLVHWLETKAIQIIDWLGKFLKEPHPMAQGIFAAIDSLTKMLGPDGTMITALGALGLLIAPTSTLVIAIIGLGVWIGMLIDKIPHFSDSVEKAAARFYDFLGIGAEAANRAVAPTRNPNARGIISRAPATPTAPRPGSAAQQSAVPAGIPIASAGGGTNVQIDSMTINTRATDADGIAGDMAGAMRRKLLVAAADTGVG